MKNKQAILKSLSKISGLLQKCGGEGGTPGPCPSGGGKEDKTKKISEKQGQAKKASDSAKEATDALSTKMKLSDWKIMMHWGGSGAYHAEDAISKMAKGDKANAVKAHERAVEVHGDSARYLKSIASKMKKKPDIDAHHAAAAEHMAARKYHAESLDLLKD